MRRLKSPISNFTNCISQFPRRLSLLIIIFLNHPLYQILRPRWTLLFMPLSKRKKKKQLSSSSYLKSLFCCTEYKNKMTNLIRLMMLSTNKNHRIYQPWLEVTWLFCFSTTYILYVYLPYFSDETTFFFFCKRFSSD